MKKHFILLELKTMEPLEEVKDRVLSALTYNASFSNMEVKNFRKIAGNQAAIDKLWRALDA